MDRHHSSSAPNDARRQVLSLPALRLVGLDGARLQGRGPDDAPVLREGRIHTVGFDRRADIRIEGEGEGEARFVPSMDRWRVSAVAGETLTVNGRTVTSAEVRPGDVVGFGGLAIRLDPAGRDAAAPEAAAPAAPRQKAGRTAVLLALLIAIVAAGGAGALWFLDRPRSTLAVPEVSYEEIVAGQGDRRVLRYAPNPDIVVLDFPTLTDQGRMMNRIAALVEKEGAPRDRVLTDEELAQFIAASDSSIETFYYGHDYRAADLADFFSLAGRDGVTLNEDEAWLRDMLVALAMIENEDGRFVSVAPAAVISLSQEQPDDPATAHWEGIDEALRRSIFQHELSHGEYFTNPGYRDYCAAFWREQLSEAERTTIAGFLETLGYDPADEDLMINEAQAFLIHTPDTRIFRAADVGMTEERLSELRRIFREGDHGTALFDQSAPTG